MPDSLGFIDNIIIFYLFMIDSVINYDLIKYKKARYPG